MSNLVIVTTSSWHAYQSTWLKEMAKHHFLADLPLKYALSSCWTFWSINRGFNCVSYPNVSSRHARNLNVTLKCGDNNLNVATQLVNNQGRWKNSVMQELCQNSGQQCKDVFYSTFMYTLDNGYIIRNWISDSMLIVILCYGVPKSM